MAIVNNSAFDRIAATNFNKSTADNKKTEEAAQNFGDALSQAAQKTENQQNQAAYDRTSASKSSYNSVNNTAYKSADNIKQADKKIEYAKDSDNTAVKEKADTSAAVEEGAEELEEEPVEKKTVDQIADILQQIIGQIKEILGVTDEELANGMESVGLQPLDLLDSANMTQLMTALTGEDSAISLVANEELYAALQDITEMVDTQVNNLLAETGLSEAELDVILQKLQESEPAMQVLNSCIYQKPDANEAESIPIDTQTLTDTVENGNAAVAEKEPVIVKEDNTQEKSMQNLSDRTQEESLVDNTKLQAQKPEGKEQEDSQPRDYGHNQNMAQNYQNNLNNTVNATGETAVHYTSESTESIMRQLADMVKIVKGEEMTEMEMQLHPASLGTVNVSLSTKGGVVTAEFTTQNEMVKAAIEAQASQLRANLEEQGVKIEAIEVSVESHQMERNLEKDSHQEQQAEEQRTQQIQGSRRRSINLNAYADGEEIAGEMQGVDDATRIAMEMMAANGNSLDLLA